MTDAPGPSAASASRPRSSSGRCAGTCSSRSATATSRPCSPTAASRSTTRPCTAGSSASRPSSRSGCAGICAPAAGRGTSTRPTSGSVASGATSTGPSTAPGQTIDFLLSAKRDKKAAKRFFRQALGRENTRNPREVVTDRLKSYPGALREMKRDGRAVALHPAPPRPLAQQPGRAGPPPHQAPNRADARLPELLDGAADAGRRRGDGDAGQGPGARRARATTCSAQRAFVHQVFGLAA